MSQYTIQQANDDLGGILHGKSINKITNPFSVARRAAQNVLAKIDPDETRQISQITIYDKVTDYAAPSDLKEKRVIDLRPQNSTARDRSVSDNLSNRMSKDFDMKKRWGSWFTVMDNGGTKYFRIKANLTPSAFTLDNLDAVDGWTADGVGAKNLASENIVYEQGALQFDINAGQVSGYIHSTSIVSEDMSDAVNKSSGFLELYIPTAAILATITSIELRWGNDDTTKYYSQTVTAAQLGALKVGRNTLNFQWNGATVVGIIDNTKIDSARITINVSGAIAISGLIVSNLFFSIAKIWDVEYYSKFIFRGSNGTWKDVPSDTTDIINLDTASYNLFLYEYALTALQQVQGKDAINDRSYFQDLLHGNAGKGIIGLYEEYEKNNPSQKEKVTSSYYSNFGFRGSDGGRFRRF